MLTHSSRHLRGNTLWVIAIMVLLAGALVAGRNPAAGQSAKAQDRLPRLPDPVLPRTTYFYSDFDVGVPPEFLSRFGPGIVADNTPRDNPISNAGATLGRVLFYDKRLSANNSTSCGSCHLQQFGFSDTARFSVGFNGKRTARHSMALANVRFGGAHFFWDERVSSLEAQVLMPIQDSIEMGMQLHELVPKLQATRFYPPLFTAAFGTPEVTQQRIAFALAQFVRSMTSAQSPLDNPLPGMPRPVRPRLDPQGQLIFNLQCASCHVPASHIADAARNIGLDSVITDAGAGAGRFRAPSLRNIAVRPPYMHDGRFKTLREVIEFYNSGVIDSPHLDPRLRDRSLGTPLRLNLNESQINALVAYLTAFTDSTFLTDPRFSDPFPTRR